MKTDINRREFLKKAGSAALTMGGVGIIAGCNSGEPQETARNGSAVGTGEMTYRTNPGNGDKVSILGYGCMRWPMIKDENGKDIIDQETTDRLIDYAIEHGVNYFDTAYPYHGGESERVIGRVLSKYPRDSYYLADKYPDAAVCCINYPDRDPYFLPRTEQFNRILEAAVAEAGERFFVADLFHSRLNNDFYYINTVDGLHPDEDGMRIIAEVVEEAIRAHFGMNEE